MGGLCCLVAVSAVAQPAPQARRFTPAAQVPLSAAQADIGALRIAKLRPQAVQLRAALSQLPAERVNIAVLDRSRIPVLVSPRPALIANLRVFASADHYTASTTQNGVVVEINGTRLTSVAPQNFRLPPMRPLVPLKTQAPAQPAPATPPINPRFRAPGRFFPPGATNGQPPAGQPPAQPDALRNVSVQRTSYGVDVSFTRFGSVYNVTMDCGSQAQDPEAIGPSQDNSGAPAPDAGACSEDQALGLAQELEVAGGGEAPQ
jgi:hypothetical protein